MLEEIKKIQGINHNEFDDMINIWIESAELDLKGIGIVNTLVESPDSKIKDAIITYVLSQLDVVNSEMYDESYQRKKDALRHTKEYVVEGLIKPEETSE